MPYHPRMRESETARIDRELQLSTAAWVAAIRSIKAPLTERLVKAALKRPQGGKT